MTNIMRFLTCRSSGKEVNIQTVSSFLNILAATKSWMNIVPLNSGDYGELAENGSRWKEHFENVSILAALETKSVIPNGHV